MLEKSSSPYARRDTRWAQVPVSISFLVADGFLLQALSSLNCKIHSEALEIVIRKQYGHEIPSEHSKSWAIWNHVGETAAICGETIMSKEAYNRFYRQTMKETDAEAVADMLEFMKDFHANTRRCVHRHHAQKLLGNRRYRKMLEENKELMWDHLDGFPNLVDHRLGYSQQT